MIKFIPNILTLMRLILTVVFLVMILYIPATPYKHSVLYIDAVFVLFVIAGLTDIVDGKIARMYNASSKFGRMLDPLVDKVLVCGGFICLAVIGQPRLFNFSTTMLAIIQWGIAGIITLREVVMTIVRHIAESRGINFAATPAGKLKMFVQSFAIGTILVKMAHFVEAAWGNWFTLIVLIAAVTITIISAMPSMRKKREQFAAKGRSLIEL
jgi:CDP-diacylglycerol---glycerol-3-phosphate 3-phosphatidyltransferase